MTERDELEAVLIDHQRHKGGCLCGWAKLGHSHPEHQAEQIIAAGWRLVPIERDLPGPDWDGPNIARGSAAVRFPVLSDDDEPLAYDDELPWDNQPVRHFNTTAERDTHTMLGRTPGMIVKVGGEYHTWTGQQWAAQPAQPDPSPE